MQNFAHYCGEGNFIRTFLLHGVFKKQIYTFYIDLHLNKNFKKNYHNLSHCESSLPFLRGRNYKSIVVQFS